MRYSKANLVFHFNYPRWICYFRVLKITFCKDPEIDDRAENCPESVSWKLLKYMWSYKQRVETPITYLRKKYTHALFIEIRNDEDLLDFKQTLTYL